jgi:hypothetical protein
MRSTSFLPWLLVQIASERGWASGRGSRDSLYCFMSLVHWVVLDPGGLHKWGIETSCWNVKNLELVGHSCEVRASGLRGQVHHCLSDLDPIISSPSLCQPLVVDFHAGLETWSVPDCGPLSPSFSQRLIACCLLLSNCSNWSSQSVWRWGGWFKLTLFNGSKCE